MSRRTIDNVASSAGLLVAIVLLAAGGLLVWGHYFVNSQVHNQLAAQKIFFPPAGNAAIKGPQFAAMQQYAGQQLVTGPQAETYADHFIAVHLSEVAGGKTYSQVSAEAQAKPNDATLQGQVATLFKGTSLRGLLLNAYAFSKFGQIAGIASYVMFAGAGILLVLAGLGLVHAQRVGRKVKAPGIVGEQSQERRAA
jgi:hypothetical protein